MKAIRELGPLYGNVDKGMYSKWSKSYDDEWTKDDFVLSEHRKGIHGGQANYKFEKLVLSQLSMRLIEEIVDDDGNITNRSDKIINLAYSQEMIKKVGIFLLPHIYIYINFIYDILFQIYLLCFAYMYKCTLVFNTTDVSEYTHYMY